MNRDDLAKEIAESRACTAREGERAFALILTLEEADEILASLRTPDGDAQQAALEEVRACMINGGDGVEGDFGWNIFRLTRARPMIFAALSASRETSGE